MKVFQRITSMLCVLLICTCVNLIGCGIVKFKTYENEYYIYQVSSETNSAFIIGLTDRGKEQEILVIPNEIDGIKVKAISEMIMAVYQAKRIYNGTENINYHSNVIKRVYIPYDVEVCIAWITDGLFSADDNPTLEGFFYIANNDVYIENQRYYYRTSLVGNKELRESECNGRPKYGDSFAANVSYYYNYEESPNDGYYWIDNYEYGDRIKFVPPDPIRDGYIFDGWYKEPECINEWDYDTDTLPAPIYDENEDLVYQETVLYSKWIENV